MADESPVGSPLSSLSSDVFEGEEENEQIATESLMPPAKRQKLGVSSMRETPPNPLPEDDALSISTDTSGEVPNSPGNSRLDEDDSQEQVTVCSWMGCEVGDLGNMDKLVHHIHEEHIETRTKKYTCEWTDCSRRSMPHASGYALKAHMRSHTREKPFYCTLPECDRAFTRSDALAKHMRTVHETEALRPSDPMSKSMHPSNRSLRMKVAMKLPPRSFGIVPPQNGHINGTDVGGWTSSYNSELGFSAEEEARGPKELYRLLRRQVHWAEEEAELLKRQCEAMEDIRKKDWLEKEVLLDQVISNEATWHQRREEVLAGKANIPSAEQIKAAAAALSREVSPSIGHDQLGEERDSVAALASMPQG